MIRTATCLLALLTAPLCASAHHAVAGSYDQSQMVELEGRVTDVLWRNPHVQLSIEIIDDEGNAEEWELATTSLSNLRRWQIAADFIEIGDDIRVAGNPAVRGRHGMYVRNVLTRSGEEILLAPGIESRWSDEIVRMSESRLRGVGSTAAPELGIFRTWSKPDNRPVLIPRGFGTRPEIRANMTQAALQAFDSFDWELDNPLRNCAPKGMPTIMEAPYPFQFTRDGEDILWHQEEFDTVRRIHMNANAPVQPQPALLGYSTGRWLDGRTLQVRTTRMNWGYFDTQGVPLSPDAEVLETFTVSESGDRLDYTLRVIDSATFVEPVELTHRWVWYPDAVVSPYECSVDAED
jgi:hypothetical protein